LDGVFFFAISEERTRKIKCNSPADYCWPPARRGPHLYFLRSRKCKRVRSRSSASPQASESVRGRRLRCFSLSVTPYGMPALPQGEPRAIVSQIPI